MMKTITFTAVVSVLMAIPFMLRKRRPQPIPLKAGSGTITDEARRYAIDDFLT
jgi:hypothetical protein